jgi:hypothetical protein
MQVVRGTQVAMEASKRHMTDRKLRNGVARVAVADHCNQLWQLKVEAPCFRRALMHGSSRSACAERAVVAVGAAFNTNQRIETRICGGGSILSGGSLLYGHRLATSAPEGGGGGSCFAGYAPVVAFTVGQLLDFTKSIPP